MLYFWCNANGQPVPQMPILPHSHSLTLPDTPSSTLHTASQCEAVCASHQTTIRTRMPHQKQRASALGFVIHLYDLKVLTPTSQKEAWQIKNQAVCHVNILVGGFCFTFLLSGAALPLYREVVKKLLWSEFNTPPPSS